MTGLSPAALLGPIRRACSLGFTLSTLGAVMALSCAAADVTPPMLVSYSYAPVTIDTASQAGVVNATLSATDDSSGLDFALIAFESPTRAKRVDCLSARGGPSTGTALSGGFTCTATFPIYSETGVWSVSFVQLGDRAGNIKYWTTADLAALKLPVQLTVTGVADLTAPALTSYSYAPLFADISSASVSVRGSITATDSLSGVKRGVLAFYSPSGSQRVDCTTGASPTSGTQLNGIWDCTGTLPRYSETGDWKLKFLQLNDSAGNVLLLDTAQLTALGMETKLKVSGTPDLTLPALVTYTLSATTIKTSSAAQYLTGAIRVSDDLSGVKSALLAFYSASGTQRVDCVSGPNPWLSGTSLSGVLQCVAVFPLGAEPGLWSIGLASVTDQAGNTAQIGASKLASMGVQLTVMNQGGTSAAVNPVSLSFQCHSYGPQPPSQSVVLSTATTGAPFTVSIPASATAWLSVSPLQGVTPAALSVIVDPHALAAGTYGATIDLLVSGAVAPVKLDVAVRVRALGDFDGNNQPDIIWQNQTTRAATMWFMQGADGMGFLASTWLSMGAPEWRIAAMADFDGNGIPDVLWQTDTSRAVTLWYMGGARGDTLLAWRVVCSSAPGWTVAGAADFDKNGTPDIIWQNDTTRTATIWYLGGQQGSLMLGWSVLNGEAPGWKIVGARDFDNNGTPDVIWQQDTTRMTTVWQLGGPRGNQLLSSRVLVDRAPGWTIRGLSDFDGNGTPDIVWQNDTSYDVTIWFMGVSSGFTLLNWRVLAVGPLNWRILVPG